MLVSVYLQDEVYNLLSCFGNFEDVVNRILQEGDNGTISIMDKPNYGSRENSRRYNVNITNETYITLYNKFPPNSSKISLRRLLNWFVYEEVYEMIGWKMTNKYVNKNREKIEKIKSKIESDLYKLLRYEEYVSKDFVTNLIKNVRSI